MSERDEQGDPDVRESVDAFRRAGTAASDGLGTLYEWSHVWTERRHSFVQFTILATIRFAGNWTYNRIAPPIITVTTTFAESILSDSGIQLVVSFFGVNPVFAAVQILLLVLLVIAVTQNRMQTRKLKMFESILTTMSNEPAEATDGGTPWGNMPSDWTICGVICGAIIGISFGPGGVLAGIYLGFWLGGKVDRRVYEQDTLTPDRRAETDAER